MIKQIISIEDFDKMASEWNNEKNFNFWTSKISSRKNKFNPDTIESRLRINFIQTITNPTFPEKIRIWSYEQKGKSVAGCAFAETFNFLLAQNCLQEIFWQFNGRLASSFKEVKILKLLSKKAEEYAKQKKLDSIIIGRNPSMHQPFNSGKIKIKNHYTNQGYDPLTFFYIKKINNS